MLGLSTVIVIGITYLIVEKLEKASEYKEPKGKHKNRYK
jgi:hypothetical protein